MNLKLILMKVIYAGFFILFTGSFVFYIAGCSKDDDGNNTTLAGTYRMTKVTNTKDYTSNGNLIIPAGTEITALAAAGILSAAPCNDSTNAAVDLRTTKELFLVCTGESGEVKAGTWEETSTLSKLDLFLSSPPFPLALQLSVTDIAYTDTKISGTIAQLTLPGDLVAPLFPDGATVPPAAILNVTVDFNKVE